MSTEFINDLEDLLEEAEQWDTVSAEQLIASVRSLIWAYREPQGDCCG